MKYLVVFGIIFFFAAFTAFGQNGATAAAPGIDEIYLAKDDGGGKPGEEVTSFSTTDIPIHCVVLLDSTVPATVKMVFVAVNVAGVRAESKVVSASYTTKNEQDRVNFTGRPAKVWTPGKYRVDIYINGKSAKHLEFEIRKSSK